ncbi:MAG: PQQ-binding-like beta-propeller repeat protein [Planctomycetota bacterium]|nr:PQQ-binding-like beta-propeller repeat protein [Planctomycetota bacterium]
MKRYATCLLSLFALSFGIGAGPVAAQDYNPTTELLKDIATLKVGAKDWPQWGGWSGKNNTPDGKNIPVMWNIDDGTNIKWAAKLGSQTYGNPVIANGKVYVGTNNGGGHLKRYPSNVDLGCLLCFDDKTGEFLWQHSSPKLATGRVHDWPLQGVCCSPIVDGERLWFVTSRGEVRCLDTEGFRDDENDGSFTAEPNENKDEADVIWVFDMMNKLSVSQHNMCSCSVALVGDVLLVNTSNGLDESHINLPSPNAPSFIALDRNTGDLLWTDKSPGSNILHGQWSSPTIGDFNGQSQVIFAGGDGWIYSFDPKGDGNGASKLLWKLDGNPKDSKWILGGRGTRNNIIATPVIYDGYVYVSVGQDPEHGEGPGHVWCIDPNKRGDVSSTLAKGKDGSIIPPRRLQDVDLEAGEKIEPNPNSAVVWHYSKVDLNGNGKFEFEETMHRTIGTAAIKNDLLFISDFSGLFHCLDAKKVDEKTTNEDGTHPPVVYWKYDMFAAAWGSPLIVDGKVYIGDEDGDIAIFMLSSDPKVAMPDDEPIVEINVGNAVYSSPIVANDTLYIANKSTLYAISSAATGSTEKTE